MVGMSISAQICARTLDIPQGHRAPDLASTSWRFILVQNQWRGTETLVKATFVCEAYAVIEMLEAE